MLALDGLPLSSLRRFEGIDLSISPEVVWSALLPHVVAGMTLVGAFTSLTALLGFTLLPNEKKKSISKWLLGEDGSEENWASSFNGFFDALFGNQHLSFRCFFISGLASLLSVFVMWMLFGLVSEFRSRQINLQDLVTVILIGVTVNVVADYLSLLETRALLRYLEKPRTWFVQVCCIFFDAILTATIIWVAIFLFQNTPIYKNWTTGEGQDFGEVLLVFSPLSVFFYSTFVTSLWVWIYVSSTLVMRIFVRMKLWRIRDVENQPIGVLMWASIPAVFTSGFLLSIAFGTMSVKDSAGLTKLDQGVCVLLRDNSCVRAATLAKEEDEKNRLLIGACLGGNEEQCKVIEGVIADPNSETAVRYWQSVCGANDVVSCYLNGVNYLYGGEQEVCDQVDPSRCYVFKTQHKLGAFQRLWEGITGRDFDYDKAMRNFEAACAARYARACTTLGVELQIKFDPKEALRLMKSGCDMGDGLGCARLGEFLVNNFKLDNDQKSSALEYLRQGCEAGFTFACSVLERPL